MDVMTITDLISSVGFPIACVIGMGYFIAYMMKSMNTQNANNMQSMQEKCAAREEKLYDAIREQRLINEKAIAAIASYVEKLDAIQTDVSAIKVDIAVIADKK